MMNIEGMDEGSILDLMDNTCDWAMSFKGYRRIHQTTAFIVMPSEKDALEVIAKVNGQKNMFGNKGQDIFVEHARYKEKHHGKEGDKGKEREEAHLVISDEERQAEIPRAVRRLAGASLGAFPKSGNMTHGDEGK